MALLTRFLPLNDINDTQVFSFVVTKSVTRDLNRDVVSKSFSYGSQKWAISFSRQEKTLGFYLVWKNPSESIKVSVDLKFVLINRENFLENREFFLENATFRASQHANGSKTFIKISELLTHRPRFVDTNGEFLVELKLSRIKTVYEKEFLVTPNEKSPILSSEFSYGVFNWIVCVKPSPIWQNTNSGLSIYLQRLKTSTLEDTTIARISYKMSVKEESSDRREEMISPEHVGSSWSPKASLQNLFCRSISDEGGYLKVLIDLQSCHSITEFVHELESYNEQKPDGDTVTLKSFKNGQVKSVDSHNCRWGLDADLHSSFLRFYLFLEDIDKILRNHLRFVQWKSFLVRRPKKWRGLREDKDQRELIDFQSGNVFSRYYSQDEFDQGVIMETTIPTKDIKEGLSEFLEDENIMRVRVQWDYNYQLFQSTFHQYDDVYKYHNQQMKTEIDALNERVRSLELLLEGERGQNNEDAAKLRTLTVSDANPPDFQPMTRSPSPVPLHLRRIPATTSRSPSPRRNAGRKFTVSQFSLDGQIPKNIPQNKAAFRRGNSTYAEPSGDITNDSQSLGTPSPSTPPPVIIGPQRLGISPPLKRFFSPLQNTLSLSAESIAGFKKSPIKSHPHVQVVNNHQNSTNRQSSPAISKCQSVD